jgi:hypothetical protein
MVIMFYTSPYLLITGQFNGFGHISEAQSMHDHVMSFLFPLLLDFLLFVTGRGFAYVNSKRKGKLFFKHSGCHERSLECRHVLSGLSLIKIRHRMIFFGRKLQLKIYLFVYFTLQLFQHECLPYYEKFKSCSLYN